VRYKEARSRLELLHGSDVGALDIVLKLFFWSNGAMSGVSSRALAQTSDWKQTTHLGNLLLDLVERDVVGDDEGDLELADTVADGDEGRGTPDEALAGDGADRLLELGHVGLVVPGLDVHGDDRLADGGRALGGLLLVVGGDTLGLDALALGVLLLVVGAEEVDVVLVLLLLSAGRGRGAAEERLRGGGVSGERRELGLERLDVRVPAGSVGVLGGRGGRLEGGEDAGVSLRGRVAKKRD